MFKLSRHLKTWKIVSFYSQLKVDDATVYRRQKNEMFSTFGFRNNTNATELVYDFSALMSNFYAGVITLKLCGKQIIAAQMY